MGKLMVGAVRVLPVCALVLLLSAVALPAAVFAQASTVTIDPTQGPVGTEVTATGTGWPEGAVVYAFFNQTQVSVAPETVDLDGNFTLKFCVPDLRPGIYPTFFTSITGMYSGPIFTITPSDPTRPPPTCQQTATCKPAFFIGLRGTGEDVETGEDGKVDGLGNTVRAFYKAFEDIYGKSNVDVHGVLYPAVDFPVLVPSLDATPDKRVHFD